MNIQGAAFDPDELVDFGGGSRESSDPAFKKLDPEPTQEQATAPAAQATKEAEEQKPPHQGDNTDDEAYQGDKAVPLKRFQKVFQERTEFKIKNETLEKDLSELKKFKESVEPLLKERETSTNNQLPAEWVALYGDDDKAREAFKVQLLRESKLRDEIVKNTVAAIQESQSRVSTEAAKWEAKIEENLDSLSDSLGKEFTKDERQAILKIVDEFTPKDANGVYASEFIPFDKAYEIYELRSKAPNTVSDTQRKKLAGMTSSGSGGSAPKNETPFRPGDWGGWRKAMK